MIQVLAIILFVLLLLVGGDRGAITVMSLAGNIAVLGAAVLFLANGTPVFLVILLATVCISYITLIRQNGSNVKTRAALASVIGIMTMLSVFIALTVWRTGAGGLNEIQAIQEDIQFYYNIDIGIPMQQVATAIVILSALGAIMDTALSVTSAVYEVSIHRPVLTKTEYVKSGMQVGKDIIGTTANTLLFAYFGESLLLFAYLVNGKYNWEIILNSKFLFQGLAMMAAGMIACLLAVPVSAYAIASVIGKEKKQL